ncbi:MAG: class I SAM-dependent RNA methyltransferase [Kiritimatiellae bacterium]|nr:class I SAM-dependent RNA methyltransferase [Kiritimatiellia bacterium]
MVKGEELEGFIEKLVYGGAGLMRVDGCVVFVPGTAQGERVRARAAAVKKHFVQADLVTVLQPAPGRQPPDCRIRETTVPGCVYAHLTPTAECEAKEAQLHEFLDKFGVEEWLPPVDSPAPLHYRNKLTLHAERVHEKILLGYRMEPGHDVVDLDACPLSLPPINETLALFRKSPAFQSLRNGDEVVFRLSDEGVSVFRPPRRKGYRRLPGKPQCWSPEDGMFHDGDLPVLHQTMTVGTFEVPCDGFFQVNPSMAEHLAEEVADWFAEDLERFPEVLDLYCGVGVFALFCRAKGAVRIFGVEASGEAVEFARRNAENFCVPGKFVRSSLGNAQRLGQNWIHNPARTTVIVDPPRGGMAANAVRAVLAGRFPKVLYVSCDPATLARDVALFAAAGYTVRRVRLMNLFPRTARFETLVELVKKGAV